MKYSWNLYKTFDVNYIKCKFEKLKNEQENNKKNRVFRSKMLEYFRTKAELDDEIKEIIAYLKFNSLTTFPYPFSNKYNFNQVEVLKDVENKMFYVFHDGKKLYFKKKMELKHVQRAYNSLLIEQDINSPHRYLTPTFNVAKNDVVFDIGAAECSLGLEIIDHIKHLYIFESNIEWIEALKQTFLPYKEKVTIINKLVDNVDHINSVSIDAFVEQYRCLPTFIKVDIEGYEKAFLDGSEKLLNNNAYLKIVICTYHKQNDFEDFSKYFNALNYNTEHSKGYMLFINDKFSAPYVRRGILRCYRQKSNMNIVNK